MRARYPDVEDFIERDGVKVGYEVFGDGDPAVVFTPVDALVSSRSWKAQVPYLSRTHTVVTIDPRGNGRSDRPTDPAAYADLQFVADTIDVMDAVGIDRAVLIGHCSSTWRSVLTAVHHPDRVLGLVTVATWMPYLTPPHPWRVEFDFEAEYDSYEGYKTQTRHYFQTNWREAAAFFFGELLSEPHSTKQFEDCLEWAMDSGATT